MKQLKQMNSPIKSLQNHKKVKLKHRRINNIREYHTECKQRNIIPTTFAKQQLGKNQKTPKFKVSIGMRMKYNVN